MFVTFFILKFKLAVARHFNSIYFEWYRLLIFLIILQFGSKSQKTYYLKQRAT